VCSQPHDVSAEFLGAEHSSSDAFYQACRDVVADERKFGREAGFVHLLLATSDYPAFLTLMKSEAEDAAADEAREKSGGSDA
jgi:hypothetical protein